MNQSMLETGMMFCALCRILSWFFLYSQQRHFLLRAAKTRLLSTIFASYESAAFYRLFELLFVRK